MSVGTSIEKFEEQVSEKIERFEEQVSEKIEEVIVWEKWKGLTPDLLGDFLLVWMYSRYFFDFYLYFRQHKLLKMEKEIPRELRSKVSKETFEKARLYQIDRMLLNMASQLYSAVLVTACIKFGALFKLWNASEFCLDFIGIWPKRYDREVGLTMLFVTIGTLFYNTLDLPLHWVSTFHVEEKHGFNKMTGWYFAKDFGMRNVVEILFGVPISVSIVIIVQWKGKDFYLYLWMFCGVMLLCGMTIYPMVIAPRFYKFNKLRLGRLREALTQLANEEKFPLDDILILKLTNVTAHSGAYYIGLFYWQKVVLYDNLLVQYPEEDVSSDSELDKNKRKYPGSKPSKQSTLSGKSVGTIDSDKGCTEEEIIAIVARLIGHWKESHILKDAIIAEINLFVFTFLFSYCYQKSILYEAFEFKMNKPINKPIFMGLYLFVNYILDIYSFVWDLFLKWVSRRFEYEADQFACEKHFAEDLREAIIKMKKDNLKYPYHDWMYAFFMRSHPSELDRIKAIDDYIKKRA